MIQEKSLSSRLFDLANYLLLLLFGMACLVPMIHCAASMGGFVTLWPIGFTLRNFAEILQAGPIYKAFWVSVERTVLGTALNMVLTVLAPYPLSKTSSELRGRNIFMWILLFAAVFHWNAWFDGMILIMDNAKYPIMTFLRTVVVDMNLQTLSVDIQDIYNLSERSIRAANTIVATVPILIVYPFLQRYFIHGIRLGAVKG